MRTDIIRGPLGGLIAGGGLVPVMSWSAHPDPVIASPGPPWIEKSPRGLPG